MVHKRKTRPHQAKPEPSDTTPGGSVPVELPASIPDGVEPIPPEARHSRSDLDVRKCENCGRQYKAGYKMQKYCWTCKRIGLVFSSTKERLVADSSRSLSRHYHDFLVWLEKSVTGLDPNGKEDVVQDMPCGLYGVVKCTPREQYLAQLLATNCNPTFAAKATNIPPWKVIDYQAGNVQSCPQFAALLHYYRDRHEFLALGAVIRELNMALKAAEANKKIDVLERVKAQVEIAKLMERQSDLGKKLASATKDRKFVIEDLAQGEVMDRVRDMVEKVLRYQKGGGPKL